MRPLAALIVVVSGCVSGSLLGGGGGGGRGVMRWSPYDRPRTQQEFLRDRYECLRDSQRQESRFAANRTFAGGRSDQVTDLGLFQACMNARGYVRDDNGPFLPPEGGEILAR